MRNGTATIAPVRWRTPDGSFIAAGTFDPAASKLDLILRSEGTTPGFFTLDTPQRLTVEAGALSVQATPRNSMRNPDAQAALALRQLAPELASLANGNACAR